MGYAAFELKICRGSKTSQEVIGSDRFTVINGHSQVGFHLHLWLISEGETDHVQAFFKRKHVVFTGIGTDGNNDLIEQGNGSENDVLVTFGDRVEGSRKNSYSFHLRVEFGNRIGFLRERYTILFQFGQNRKVNVGRKRQRNASLLDLSFEYHLCGNGQG